MSGAAERRGGAAAKRSGGEAGVWPHPIRQLALWSLPAPQLQEPSEQSTALEMSSSCTVPTERVIGAEPEAQVFGVQLVAKTGEEMDVLLEVDAEGITLRETGGEPLCAFELSALEAWGRTEDGFTFVAVGEGGARTRCSMRTELGAQISEACHVAAARLVEQLKEMDSRLVENLEEAVSEVRLDSGAGGGGSSSSAGAPRMFYVQATPAAPPAAAPAAEPQSGVRSLGLRSKLGSKLGGQWPGRAGAAPRAARPHQD